MKKVELFHAHNGYYLVDINMIRRIDRMEKLSTRSVHRCYKCEDKVGDETRKRIDSICCSERTELTPRMECTKDPAWAEHARFMDSDDPCQL